MACTKVTLLLAILLMSPMTAQGICLGDLLLAVGAGAAAVVLAPVAVAAVGFGAGGIAAGSLAASAMSTAATTGYGMAAVSTLQSIGAAGMAASHMAVVGGAVIGTVYGASETCERNC
ncbi:interferon alpha-inducible protein 27-like protein 2A isoform X1 [Pomacea canaliculata]|uniref:interferon alpha-inducible protein 27-like protein 2A isoform X1 n=1 Tax=Pomacea canaliculata TaxID=400727 RepID=UPI000D73677E|nr:interferon alpha-inducible protein 27-like protein 2A isoform X1 [Pomacea canaliculata]